VGNPPYINVSDPALRETYRARYGSCHGQYNLGCRSLSGSSTLPPLLTRNETGKLVSSADCLERLHETVLWHGADRGLHAQLGCVPHCRLIWGLLPRLRHATTILFGRNRKPRTSTIRVVQGIRAEAGVPEDPSVAPVWKAVVEQIDRPGSESPWSRSPMRTGLSFTPTLGQSLAEVRQNCGIASTNRAPANWDQSSPQ